MLVAAAILTILLGIAHSYLGERYLLVRMFNRELAARSPYTKRVMRLAWHLATIFLFGFAAILFGVEPRAAIVGTMAVSALLSIVMVRGRHLSWAIFLAIAALTFFGIFQGAHP